ncbi:STS [Branchiostoma lanceolatum]|uniref:STS protein n=1 Tax=Branchiostoma lanceolatum TaxID=7740 RepID=A0A8K0EYP9_BRALA|nr:STS [Branchiostoma lanceolatum]
MLYPVWTNRRCRHLWAAILFLATFWTPTLSNDKRPNFVLIMVDDLGIGDVGCFGNDTIRTPNIDRIASEGAKLTQHLTAEAICTPSRAAFLTGRYPVRMGMSASGHNWRYFPFVAGAGGLPQNETTFATLLNDAGYSTALVGKWHLGLNCKTSDDHCHHPNKHGFDFFFGTPITNFRECADGAETMYVNTRSYKRWRNACVAVFVGSLALLLLKVIGKNKMSWSAVFALLLIAPGLWIPTRFFFSHRLRRLNCILMNNDKLVAQPFDLEDDMTPRLLAKSLNFLRENQNRPFLLYHSFLKVHSALFATEQFRGRSRHGPYGDNVEEMDWAVGEILKEIDRLGMSENTFVYLSSDNGGHLEEITPEGEVHGGWNGIYKGGKAMGGWEGGIRVPTVLRWPRQIRPGTVISEPTSMMDVFPTVLRLAGTENPEDRVIDGRDMMPLLAGNRTVTEHEFLIHYCGESLAAARYRSSTGNSVYKAHYMTPIWDEGTGACYSAFACGCENSWVNHHDPPLLFDIANDPSESNLITPENEPKFAEIVANISRGVETHKKTLVSVESQFSLRKVLWRPWMQPCCNFPYCSCDLNETSPTMEKLLPVHEPTSAVPES